MFLYSGICVIIAFARGAWQQLYVFRLIRFFLWRPEDRPTAGQMEGREREALKRKQSNGG